jgi:hypothetical protein
MPLTLLSNVLFNFGGGPGRIAIHGRDGPSLENPLGSRQVRPRAPGVVAQGFEPGLAVIRRDHPPPLRRRD